MSKLVLNILFSSLLIFQTAVMAEEKNASIETHVEEQELQEEVEATEETEVQPEASQVKNETTEPKEVLSEAQKEALAAEEAELREAGIYDEEPVEE